MSLCEHLPHLAKQAHHLAIVRSLGDHGRGTGDHHAGYYYNLTGHAPDRDASTSCSTPARRIRPTGRRMASVVALKRPPHPFLPQAITLPHKEGAPEYTRPGQFAARLGLEYDPSFVDGTRERPLDFTVPALSLRGDVPAERLLARRQLAQSHRRRPAPGRAGAGGPRLRQAPAARPSRCWRPGRRKAAFDLRSEPEAVRASYGPGINAMSMLLARRLVEAGVPFVTVFWKGDKELDTLCKSGGGWDTHGNNFNCLKDRLLPEFDRPFAALLDDLHQRGLLEQTLVLVSSEMGRKPKIGDPRSGGAGGAGRDHWTAVHVGAAGRRRHPRRPDLRHQRQARAEYPADNPVAPEHIARTVLPRHGHRRPHRHRPRRPALPSPRRRPGADGVVLEPQRSRKNISGFLPRHVRDFLAQLGQVSIDERLPRPHDGQLFLQGRNRKERNRPRESLRCLVQVNDSK